MSLALPDPVVFLVDTDADARSALQRFLLAQGLLVRSFTRMADFLAEWRPEIAGCLVLDVGTGQGEEQTIPVLLRELVVTLPVILTAHHGCLDTCRRAFRNGATDFFARPLNEQALLDSIRKALQEDSQRLRLRREASSFREQLAQLSDREKQVLELMLEGLPNKLIAQQIGLSTRTVESHRSRIYLKLQADSLAQLVRRVVRLEEIAS
jgi:RNA polymerase sigma factor (sigma-70 family)